MRGTVSSELEEIDTRRVSGSSESTFAQPEPGVTTLPLELLNLGESPRLNGVNPAHVRALAELEDRWPPLLVTQDNWVIIDGLHRYFAAKELRRTSIACFICDIAVNDCFVESVRSNVTHGLPLTPADRRHAASVILRLHREWSDRRIAELCGLHHSTIARLRANEGPGPSGENAQLDSRRGRDGRERPVDRAAARDRVRRALESEPGASLRSLAKMSGSSPETVRLLRNAAQKSSGGYDLNGSLSMPLSESGGCCVAGSGTDRAFQSTSEGRSFLVWFSQMAIGDDWIDRAAAVPLNRVYEIADEARRRSKAWLEFATVLETRAGRGQPSSVPNQCCNKSSSRSRQVHL